MFLTGTLIAVTIVSIAGTGIVRRAALKWRIIDEPGARSSHTAPTPRGGGLGMLLGLFGGLAALYARDLLPWNQLLMYLAAIPVAAVGLVDDRHSVRPIWRFLTQLSSAALGLYGIGGFGPLNLGVVAVDLGWIGHLLAALGIVWIANLYNFMDGIDGIAGVEGIFVALGLAWLSNSSTVTTACLVLAVAIFGFLVWNWPPARIFMGDVGSGALGLIFGLLVASESHAGNMWLPLILLGGFLADSGVTLVRRIARGERWYQAHRSHAYQHAAQRWGHRTVTTAVAVINIAWLLPWAWVSSRWPAVAPLALVGAIAPLVLLVSRLGAGQADTA
jgi:Fuc2NAc and GlcNAc transferase